MYALLARLAVHSPDGLVRRVVADVAIGVAWASDEGQLYESRAAMQAAGAAPHPATAGGRLAVTVPEIVTAPFRALNEPRRDWDDVLRRLDELDAYWDRAPGGLNSIPDEGMRLAEVFEGSGYLVNPDLEEVHVVRIMGRLQDKPLLVQPSVGVPLGGGLLVTLEEVLRRRGLDRFRQQLSWSAMRFGWRVARAYLDSTASAALAPGSDVADVVMVAEVMALAFAEVSGGLGRQIEALGQGTPEGLDTGRCPAGSG